MRARMRLSAHNRRWICANACSCESVGVTGPQVRRNSASAALAEWNPPLARSSGESPPANRQTAHRRGDWELGSSLKRSRPSPLSREPACLGRPTGESRIDHPDFRRGLRAARHPIGPQNPGGYARAPAQQRRRSSSPHQLPGLGGASPAFNGAACPPRLEIKRRSALKQLGDVEHPRAYRPTCARLPKGARGSRRANVLRTSRRGRWVN